MYRYCIDTPTVPKSSDTGTFPHEDWMDSKLPPLNMNTKAWGLECYMSSLGLVVTEICCHKIYMNTKEKYIIRSIIKE